MNTIDLHLHESKVRIMLPQEYSIKHNTTGDRFCDILYGRIVDGKSTINIRIYRDGAVVDTFIITLAISSKECGLFVNHADGDDCLATIGVMLMDSGNSSDPKIMCNSSSGEVAESSAVMNTKRWSVKMSLNIDEVISITPRENQEKETGHEEN